MEASEGTKLGFFRLWFEETVGAPFPYQNDLLDRIAVQGRPLIINKARQTGISTVCAAIAIAKAVFEAWPVLIVSNREENAAHILEYAGKFLDNLKRFPIKLHEMTTDKTTRITFENGGEVRCLSANPSTARGYPAKLVFFDEFAHFRGEANLDKKMLEAVSPSISQIGGTLVILSTPYGKGNEFSRLWDNAPPENRYTIHYTQCPSLKVRVEELPYGKRYWVEGSPAPLSEAAFKTEFCNDFEAVLSTAIPSSALWAPENIVKDDEAWE